MARGDPGPSGGCVPALALGGFTVSLVNTLPVPLLPALPELLHTTPAGAYWVATATLLTAAVSTPVAGRLGDLHGRRAVLLWCLGLMIAGSLLCALAGSLGPLLAGRALQGCAAGAVPLGLSLVHDTVPRERRTRAIAAMSSAIGIGGTVGFPLSALVAQDLDWHWLFAGVAGLGAANLLLALLLVPASSARPGGRFDWPGALTLSASLVCLLLALSEGAAWGLAAGAGLAAAGATLAIGWACLSLCSPHPLIDLRAAASRTVLLGNAAAALVGFAMLALSMILPLLLQSPRSTGYGAGLSMAESGLVLGPAGLAMMLTAPVSARLCERWGRRATLALGAGLVGAGYVVAIPLLGASGWLAVVSILVGAGLGLAFTAVPALIASAVPPSQLGAANGLNTLMRQVGAASSGAFAGAVFTVLRLRDGHPSPAGLSLALVAACIACAAVALAAAAMEDDSGARGCARRGEPFRGPGSHEATFPRQL